MAVDYYLQLDGIQGESVAQNFQNQIQLLSFSWGGSQVTSVSATGGSGAGKVNLADFSITKNVDKASTPLFKALVSGTHLSTGVLSATKAGSGGKAFLKVNLQELFITDFHLSASTEIPTESISFSYNQIQIQYSTQDDKGTLTLANQASYNLKQNLPS